MNQVYLTDLSTRQSTLLCKEEHSVLRLALQGEEWIWVATTDSSLHKWPACELASSKTLQRASSFVAGSLPFARARANIDGSAPVCYAVPILILLITNSCLFLHVFRRHLHVLSASLPQLICRNCLQLQVPLYTQPTSVIPGAAGIVQHAILNDRRHVLTKVCLS